MCFAGEMKSSAKIFIPYACAGPVVSGHTAIAAEISGQSRRKFDFDDYFFFSFRNASFAVCA